MNRRYLLKALFAVPLAAVAAPLAAALAPKPFAKGGIVPAGTPYLVGESLIPDSIHLPVTTSVDKGPTQVGTITINLKCDTANLEDALLKIQRNFRRF